MEEIYAKTILQRSKASMDGWIYQDYNMNLYRGCSHGCIYCDSRSLCYGIDNFDLVKPKKDAIKILELELMSKRIKGVCAMGSMSDPYNPLEKKLELTRNALKLFYKYGFGTSVITKSAMVTRDIDLFKLININKSVIVNITITTVDNELQKLIEPNSSTTLERFKAIKQLNEAGIKAGLMLMPILPYINDSIENLDKLIELAREYKAHHIFAIFGVTLRDRQREYYYKHLKKLFPGIVDKYKENYGESYSCQSPNAKMLYEHLTKKCEEYKILYKIKSINESFLKIPKQLALEL
ncbi:MAG: radical SAM protein [Tenericutes bacterium]|nr:radical SAM protein [Mycoplasmatota bacterium]